MTVFPERVVVGDRTVVFCVVGELADRLVRLIKMVPGDVVLGLSCKGIAGVLHKFHLAVF